MNRVRTGAASAPATRGTAGDVARADRMLARAADLGEQRQFDEAVALARRALKLYEKALGPDHPDTKDCLTWMS